jgi:hypothetical protein
MFRLEGSQITDRHIYAADRLRAAVDLAAIGVSRSQTLMPTGLTFYGPVSCPSPASLRQARAGTEVKRAIARFTEGQCALLHSVVLQNHSLKAWCKSAPGRTPGIEMGKLICILDILTEHYASKIGYDLAQGRVLLV